MSPAVVATILVLSMGLAGAVCWALFERRRVDLGRTSDALSTDLRALLDALPSPVWTRDAAGKLVFANAAFLDAVGHAQQAQAEQAGSVLERSEIDLFAEASERGRAHARRFVEVGGQRRTLDFQIRALQNNETAAIAVDVSEESLVQSKLVLEIDGHRDVINQLAVGVAVFGPDRRLLFLNRSFRRHYGIAPDSLTETLYFEELLDRLRAEGRLPERRDFLAWKRRMVALFDEPRSRYEEIWHLPNGRSERVTSCPHPLGGLTFFIDDLTTELELQSAYNAVVKTQKATLDTITEAVAVFGPDGRLRLHNDAFSKLWQLSEPELASRPHLSRIASACAERMGADEMWALVAAGVNAAEPQQYNSWNTIKRADGHMIALSLTRLPDGATMATFSDLSGTLRRAAMPTKNRPAA